MHTSTRLGYSLLEVIAVLALIGILAASAVVRLTPESISNFGAKTDARRVAVDLLQARRRAIATGDNHLLGLTYDSGVIVGYTVQKRLADSSTVDVDTLRRFPDGVTVAVAPSAPEFTFEGAALAAYTITLTAPDRTWQVTVAQATGAAQVAEL